MLFVIMLRELLTPRLSGTLLLHLLDDENRSRQLHRFDLVSGALEPIGGEELNTLFMPAFSPELRLAAYIEKQRIYLANLDGTDAHALTSGVRDFDPQWSPDGTQIVFMRARDYFSALYIVDVATGEEHQLTDYTNDLEPDWSPDGQRIVFTTSRDGFQELYTMSPDGSNQTRLTVNEYQNDLEADFSPDGSMIAYMTNYSVGDGTGEIWLMNSDGSNQRRLTDNQRDDRWPVWSLDGRMIAFTSTREDRSGSDIFVYDLTTSELRQLTDYPGHERNPVWSPDSMWIGFTADYESPGSVYVVRADASAEPQPILADYKVGHEFVWLP